MKWKNCSSDLLPAGRELTKSCRSSPYSRATSDSDNNKTSSFYFYSLIHISKIAINKQKSQSSSSNIQTKQKEPGKSISSSKKDMTWQKPSYQAHGQLFITNSEGSLAALNCLRLNLKLYTYMLVWKPGVGKRQQAMDWRRTREEEQIPGY